METINNLKTSVKTYANQASEAVLNTSVVKGINICYADVQCRLGMGGTTPSVSYLGQMSNAMQSLAKQCKSKTLAVKDFSELKFAAAEQYLVANPSVSKGLKGLTGVVVLAGAVFGVKKGVQAYKGHKAKQNQLTVAKVASKVANFIKAIIIFIPYTIPMGIYHVVCPKPVSLKDKAYNKVVDLNNAAIDKNPAAAKKLGMSKMTKRS